MKTQVNHTRDLNHKSHSKNTDYPPRYKNISFEEDICIHIFVVSASLLGVCLMVIGIINSVPKIANIETLSDDLLAADSILFLITCFLSYIALRARTIKRMHRVEQVADILFLLGLTVLAMSCLIITYALI